MEDGGNESRRSYRNSEPHVQSFFSGSPEIFIINATFILLIHGVVFSTSKKDDYPPLVSNVGWLGLLSVARLGGQRAWDAEELLSPSSLT